MALSLTDRIALAQTTLNKTFGPEEGQEGKGADRFLNEQSLAQAYKLEAADGGIIKQFLTMSKSIRGMRSSYLPVTFFKNDLGRFSIDVDDNIAKMESYENTFMRMLGMPSVGTNEFALSDQDSRIRSGETLLMVRPETGEVVEASFEEIRAEILTERQKHRKVRRILIDNSIYNISEDSSLGSTISIRGLTDQQKAALLGVDYQDGQIMDPRTNPSSISTEPLIELELNDTGTGYINPFYPPNGVVSTTEVQTLVGDVSAEETQARITSIEDDMWKFSYLLLPPIQNIEIARCINEPKKIVAPPFSNPRTRTINDSNIRPTLLESVIRIRLDKISGTDTFFNSTAEGSGSSAISASISAGNEEIEPLPDSYGMLESLFVLRLRSSITGLAHKLYSDIDSIVDEMEKSRRTPVSENTDTEVELPREFLEAGEQMRKDAELFANNIADEKEASLQEQKLIEDSIMFLLGDNSEALDLQAQTQRNSTIHDAHMMSGLISIIDVPRKRINSELEKVTQSKNDRANLGVEEGTQEIGVTLGTDIGIGTIDLAVFSLALFTITEKSLLGLLSKEQYNRIKKGEFKALLPEEGDKEDTIVALNEFTQLIIDGYNLFKSDLENEVPLS
jgi:hypothetical protein